MHCLITFVNMVIRSLRSALLLQGVISHESRILKQREEENRVLAYRSHVQVLAVKTLHIQLF